MTSKYQQFFKRFVCKHFLSFRARFRSCWSDTWSTTSLSCVSFWVQRFTFWISISVAYHKRRAVATQHSPLIRAHTRCRKEIIIIVQLVSLWGICWLVVWLLSKVMEEERQWVVFSFLFYERGSSKAQPRREINSDFWSVRACTLRVMNKDRLISLWVRRRTNHQATKIVYSSFSQMLLAQVRQVKLIATLPVCVMLDGWWKSSLHVL